MAIGIDTTGAVKEALKGLTDQTQATDSNTQSIKKNQSAKSKLANTEKKLGKNVDDSTKKLKQQEHHTRNLHGTFSVLRSKLLLASFAFRSFQQTLGATVKETGEFNAAQARLLQGMKNSGNVMNRTAKGFSLLAADMQESTGISDTMIINNMALMSTFQKVHGTLENGSDVFESSISAILDYTAAQNFGVVTSENLRSSTIQVGKALNDPIKGYTALARNGVVFSKSQVKMIEAFQETGQLAKAQAVILKELNKEFGGTASLDTYERSVRLLGTSFGDLQKRIGAGLAPMFKQMADALATAMKNVDPSQVMRLATALGAAYLQLKLWSVVAPIASKGTKGLAISMSLLSRSIPKLAGMAIVNVLAMKLFNTFDDLDDAAERLIDVEADLSEENRRLLQSFTGMDEATQRIEFKKLTDELQTLNNEFDETQKKTPKLAIIDPSQIKLVTDGFGTISAANIKLVDINKDTKKQLQDTFEELKKLNPAFMSTTGEIDNTTAATLRTKAALDQSNATRSLEIGKLKLKIKLLRDLLGIQDEDVDAIHNTSKNLKKLTKLYEGTTVGKLETINKTKELIENMKAEAEAYDGTDEAQIKRNKTIIEMAEVSLPKLTKEAEKAKKELVALTFEPGFAGMQRDFGLIGESMKALYDGDFNKFKEGFAALKDFSIENVGSIADGFMNLGTMFGDLYSDQLSAIEENMNAENERFEAQQREAIAGIRSGKKRAKAEAQLEAELAKNKVDIKKKMAQHRLKEVDINFYTSVMRAFADNHWTVALGITSMLHKTRKIQKAGIESSMQFARGGDFITSGPTPMLVGDNPGGRERVQITPLSSPNFNGPGTGGNITLNVSAPLVDEHILDTIIPKINEAVSTGAELRSSHTDFAEDRLG